LRVLQGGAGGEAEDALGWVAAWRAPRARLDEGRHLAAVGVRCAGDISDGLVVDAARTAAASGCAAELWLDAIPVEPGVGAELALAGGEDFELLCAVTPAALEGVLASWPGELAPLRHLGRLVEGAGVLLLDTRGGSRLPLPPAASRHWG
ncbi:MAG: AIR synthase-related protein, partial [Candidatus Dormibacteria bacterium]